ncbi:MAG: aminotransferase class V-fold PLP-dependent enzyme, partial [Promethearchaeota archaeon]
MEEIRVDFPILRKRRERDNKPCIYLDNTATSLKPRQVIDGIVDYYENHCANVHRGVYRLAQEASKLYEEAHDVVARFIGAENRTQMIFVKNATEAINYIAY